MKVHNYDTELDELLDCPFCGGRPIAWLSGNEYFVIFRKKVTITIKCQACKVQRTVSTLLYGIDWLENKSIELWNTRKLKES